MLITTAEQQAQLDCSDWRLELLVSYAVLLASRAGFDLKVTGVARSHDRTVEIYRAELMTKTQAANLQELVRRSVLAGLA